MTDGWILGVSAAAASWLAARALAAAVGAGARRAVRLSRLPAAVWRAGSVAALVAGASVGAAVAGRPLFGLLAGLSAPLILPALGRWQAERRAAALEGDAIGFLHALLGLARAGVAIPSALFRLVEALPGGFAGELAPFLRDFGDGRPLDACLDRFRRRRELRLVGCCLAVLQTAHREGLPVAPFLDRMLPLLEAERRGREEMAAVRRSVAVQAAVAFAAPWVVAGALGGRAETPWIAGALVWEGIGVWLLWNVSRFY